MEECASGIGPHTLKGRLMAIVASVAAMTLGGMLYILCRSETLLMFSWFEAIGIDEPIVKFRMLTEPYAGALPEWAYYSLPQALWLLSGCLAIHAIWGNWWCRWETVWMLIVLAMALGGELGQAVGLVHGIFDWVDMALILFAFIAAQIFALAHSKTDQPRETNREQSNDIADSTFNSRCSCTCSSRVRILPDWIQCRNE